MFVVTGLHTKRRPVDADNPGAAIKKRRTEKPRRPPVVPHPPGHLAAKFPSLPLTSNGASGMAWNDGGRHEKGRCAPIKFALGRPARKFIPKPLILVERMKARRLKPESSPPVVPGSLNRSMTAITTPTHVTPVTQRVLTCGVLSSDSRSSSSVSFRMSSLKGIVFGGGFRKPHPTRRISAAALGDSSSSPDTFVADSPCCVKQASKGPTLVDAANIHVPVESDSVKSISNIGITASIDLMTGDFLDLTGESMDTFEPAMTSTPFGQAKANDHQSPTTLVTSTCPSQQTSGYPDSAGIVSSMSPTSRAVYPFNAQISCYKVKLPDIASTIPSLNKAHSSSKSSAFPPYSEFPKHRVPLTALANAPWDRKQPPDVKRTSHVMSPTPALVLDGVFTLSHALPSIVTTSLASSASSSPASSKQVLGGVSRSRKPSLRSHRHPPPIPDTPADTHARPSSMHAITPRSQPSPPFSVCPFSVSSCGFSPASPRSKLARVLTTHAEPYPNAVPMPAPQVDAQDGCNAARQDRGHGRVPPLAKGVKESNDRKMQCEIKELRTQRVADLARGGGGSGKGAIGRMSLVSVGMVARLRAMWERGDVGGRFGAPR